jgi:Holliday junction resolvase-like predicted endonuclease
MPSSSQSIISSAKGNNKPFTRQARNKLLGAIGEYQAKHYLESELNWSILDSNWHHSRLAEIDIIARTPSKEFSFIEVKTRISYADDSLNSAFETINNLKRSRLLRAARHYLIEKNLPYSQMRFDLIVIEYPVHAWTHIYQLFSRGLTTSQVATALPSPAIIHVENALAP